MSFMLVFLSSFVRSYAREFIVVNNQTSIASKIFDRDNSIVSGDDYAIALLPYIPAAVRKPTYFEKFVSFKPPRIKHSHKAMRKINPLIGKRNNRCYGGTGV